MHNIKDIRKDLKSFEEHLKKRFVNVDIDEIKKLDENNRELIQKKETLEQEKKKFQNQKIKIYSKDLKKYHQKLITIQRSKLKLKID